MAPPPNQSGQPLVFGQAAPQQQPNQSGQWGERSA
jgi:hypothetical protein